MRRPWPAPFFVTELYSHMDVVVVESPAKAKTINKYLGSGFTVLASYGHVRDLPAKNGSVDPDHDFNMIWQIGERSEQHLNAIAKATKAPVTFIWRPTPTVKAKLFPGMYARNSSRETCSRVSPSSASSSMK